MRQGARMTVVGHMRILRSSSLMVSNATSASSGCTDWRERDTWREPMVLTLCVVLLLAYHGYLLRTGGLARRAPPTAPIESRVHASGAFMSPPWHHAHVLPKYS